MKRNWLICLCGGILTLLTETAFSAPDGKAELSKKPPLVFVLSGQSNMVGQGARTDELSAEQRKLPPNVRFFDQGKETSLDTRPYFGPEVAMAPLLSARFPDREIWLFKYAFGGTSLYAWSPEWSEEKAIAVGNKGAALYPRLISSIRDVAGDQAVEYAGLFWMQGERDALYDFAAAEYEQNFIQFAEAVRRDLKTPDMPVLIGQIDPAVAQYRHASQVRAAQEKLGKTGRLMKMVSTEGLVRIDAAHFDTASQLRLGERFARAWLEYVKELSPKKPPLVFVLSGKSNMVGQGARTDELSAEQRKLPANVRFFYMGRETSLDARHYFGPEVAMALRLAASCPDREIWLIKYAVGGTSLYAWSPEWSEEKALAVRNEKAGPLYPKLIGTISEITGDQAVEYAGFFWMQGEQDSKFDFAAAAYAQNFTQFAEAVRSDLKAPDMPVFTAQIDPAVEYHRYVSQVRAAQEKLGKTGLRMRMVSTEGFVRNDAAHFDSASQLLLGERFAQAWLEYVKEP
jgi:hypothetical protein